ncbi:hypothetical protein ACJ5H2_13560 [Nocardioides sp. R1-1]|uniref:hypothetical protein n=1 Tax=Nocardioides sp. R1-1 TaxID=3383502 RepID=UPI0038D227A8
MAHISHRLGPFTGQVGPVVFVNGEAETNDEDMLLYFLDDPDTYDVTDAHQDEDPTGDPDPDDSEG